MARLRLLITNLVVLVGFVCDAVGVGLDIPAYSFGNLSGPRMTAGAGQMLTLTVKLSKTAVTAVFAFC